MNGASPTLSRISEEDSPTRSSPLKGGGGTGGEPSKFQLEVKRAKTVVPEAASE